MKNNLLHVLITMIIVLGIWQNSFAQNSCIDPDEIATPFYGANFTRNSYVRIADANDDMSHYLVDDLTLDFWVYPQMTSNINNWYFIFGYGRFNDDHHSLSVAFERGSHDGAQEWAIRVSDGTSGNYDLIYKFSDEAYEQYYENKWRHICVTYNEIEEKLILYVDGNSKAEQTSFNLYNYLSSDPNSARQTYCYLGEGLGTTSSDDHNESFVGYISGFRLWNRVLSDDERDYVRKKTFFQEETFTRNGLFENLIVNQRRDYYSSHDVFSSTLFDDNIEMTSYNLTSNLDHNHPAFPTMPYDLTKTEYCSYIRLDFQGGIDGTTYIQRKEVGQDDSEYRIKCRTNTNFFEDYDVEPGIEYTYKLDNRWYNDDNIHGTGADTSHYFDSENIYINARTKMIPYPSNFRITASQSSGNCNGEIHLSWINHDWSNGNIIKYKIENGAWETLSNTTSSDTSYNHHVSGSDLAKTIYYKIQDYGDGCTFYSSEIDGSANSACTTEATNVHASVEEGNIKVNWDFTQANAPATEFKIYRKSLSEFEYLPISSVNDMDIREIIDNNAEMCIEYLYKVEARNACNLNDIGALSLPSNDTAIISPFNNIFTYNNNGTQYAYFDASKGYYNQKIVLEWSVNPSEIANIDSYEIYRKKISDNSYIFLEEITNPNASYYEDNNAEANIVYNYIIRAIGNCPGAIPENLVSDSLSTLGFRTNTGIVSGKITYQGGNTVEDAEVLVSTNEGVTSSSLLFDGVSDFLASNDLQNDSLIKHPLSIDTWVKPKIMSSGEKHIVVSAYSGIIYLGFLNMQPIGGINTNIIGSGADDPIVTVKDTNTVTVDQWVHLNLNFSPSTGVLQLFVNGELVDEKIISNSTSVIEAIGADTLNLQGSKLLTVGCANSNGYANFFKGNIDELRLWQKFRDPTQIKQDHKRILAGSEEKLIAYYRFDENIGTASYDISKQGNIFNKNNLYFPDSISQQASWSSHTPNFEQLHPSGITDENGNYVIKGIRYSGSGNIFQVTPFLGVHEFNPTNTNLFIGDSEPVHNNIDFVDQSSFQVTGHVIYKNTDMPVSGVYIKIDGNFIQGSDNQIITTNSDGFFDIQVPIGRHYITVEKQGHVFKNDHYPFVGPDTLFFFNAPIYGIDFIDTTTVKLAGRVVGGAVEASKKLGSLNNPINNNLGICKITFTTDMNYVLDMEDNAKTSITVQTDATTGIYEINLPPEVYIIDTVKVNDTYNFLDGEAEVISLTNCFPLQYTIDSSTTEEGVLEEDSVYFYNLEKSWIWRSTPQISVDNTEGTKFLGDSEYYVKESDGTTDTIQIASMVNGAANYVFEKPVYSMGREYKLIISAFETYTNNDDGEIDTVVVSDGQVHIFNECANNTNQVSLEFNNLGQALYQFFGGFPNLASPFTKKLEIKLLVGDTYYNWAQSPLYGYVSGNIPTGNNFVTEGPTSIDFVLRDPPGSNSYSYMEDGLEISKTVSSVISNGNSGQDFVNYHLGTTIETEAGTPFFSVTQKYEMENNVGIGVEHSEDWGNELEENVTINYSQTFSTSGDPAYVGAMGDLFLGHGNNIVYGLSNFFQILTVDDVPSGGETIDDTVSIDNKNYTIATKPGLNFGKQVSTTFIYSQNHIENYLIPNLKMLRNLTFDNNSEYYSIGSLNITDTEDDRFLANNDDYFVWGSDTSQNKYNGPSYVYSNPDGDDMIDSVRYYNHQINEWIQVLKDNEYAKLNSGEDHHFPSNISFDAGAEYEANVEIDSLSSHNKTFEWTISPYVAAEFGMSFNGTGLTFELEEHYNHAHSHSTQNDTVSSQTIGFVLADGDQGDYFSVNIRRDSINGFGPIFSTVGGQSSCPYENAEYTDYYEPGTLLAQATMQIEIPHISVDNNIVAGVPETEAAVFNLALSNTSESHDDVWYILYVEPTSNPNGAVIKMDGNPISGNPVAILIPDHQTVYKTLTVEKGQLDINDYENMQIILHSECQYDPTDDIDDIADTILISAHFTPACTEVEFAQIYDNWTANYYNNDTLSFNITGYNINSTKFKTIDFQYAIPGGPRTTKMVFYKDSTDYANASGEKTWIQGSPTMSYNFPLGSLTDGNYQLYLKTTCNDGSEFVTEPLNGIIDRVIPAPFGTPQPADGILSYGENISVQFNEPINSGNLYAHANYIDVRGMTNGTDLTNSPTLLHDASIHFDGIEHNMQVNHVNLDHTDFTIEFWAKRDAIDTRSNILTLGTPLQGGLWVGFDTDNHFVIEIDGQTITSTNTYTNIGNWAFYSLVYHQGDDTNEQGFTTFVLSDANETPEVHLVDVYSSLEGSLSVGYCSEDGSAFNGNIHELRIWNYARNSTEIGAQKGQILNGYEEGLYSLWPMNEASGTVAKDIAFGRNSIVNATWQVSRDSKALKLEGNNVLSVPAGSLAFSSQSDFTVEFWYKMAMPTSNATLLSNGNPEQEPNINSWNITATSSGEFIISNNGTNVSINAQTYLDDQWHHFAMSMNRIGYLSIYFDGELVETQSVSPFEGFGAGRLVAGARWYNLSMSDHYDQYVTGTMDEIRVWNSARTRSQIQRYMNHTLKGDEFGLKAYFPFEDVTIADPSISNENSGNFTIDTINIAGDTLLTSQYFTTESPNMKLQRPEVSIPHTYIINNDEVIITPNIQANLIENQILDISIKNVKDMNNNKMASTLTWNAFIDKNQVVWDVQDLQITKFVEEEKTITVNIQNKGGMNENYTISNIPSWMEVSPSSGNLSPLETQEIEITIRPELNIGSYQTDINLVASMSYNERLGISVQVNGHAPDWTVNPSDYSKTANIIGQLSIGNILSTDENDIVACFVGDECRGVSNVQYFENGNMYLVFMNIYANTNGETMSFKVYDASTGDIYSNVSPEITFIANELYGSVSSPLPINATNYVDQSIELAQGWNWVSFNVYADEFNNLNTAFTGLNYQFTDYIKSQTQFASVRFSNNWFGNLTALNVEQTYKMKVHTAQTMIMSGYRIIADTVQIPITQGWNWIGYPLSTQKPLMDALSSLSPQDDDIIKSQHEFAVYSSVLGWVGSLTYMQPGEGYVMYSSNSGTLNYMSGNSQARTAFAGNDNSDLPNSEQNMTIIANAILDNPSAYEIKAYDKNGLCGKSEAQTMTDGTVKYFITINSQSPETIRFEAIHNLGSLEANESVSFEANNRVGTLNQPFELTFDSKGFDNVNAISVYPNPFNQQVQLSMVLDDKQTVEISLFNAIGVQLSSTIKIEMNKGYQEIDILKQMNLDSELSKGVYFVKARINGTEEIIKIVKQ